MVSDKCVREDTATCTVLVKIAKETYTMYCYNGIATVITCQQTAIITVWAKDLDAGSYDNCTVKSNLVISFDQAGDSIEQNILPVTAFRTGGSH